MATESVPVPEAMKQLLALFASDLADVRFGDLDRAALESAALVVEGAAADLADAERAAAVADAALGQARAQLLQKGQRALAHALIYAETMPELQQRLSAITLDRGASSDLAANGVGAAATRRRGRPPKTANQASGTLLLEPSDELQADHG